MSREVQLPIILNRKYNIFNVPCVKNETCHKFFKNCFYECIESKENPEILLEIFKNKTFLESTSLDELMKQKTRKRGRK